MKRFLLFLIFAVSCTKMHDDIYLLNSDDPIVFSLNGAQGTRGELVGNAQDMANLGVYCAYTAGGVWSKSSEFNKLDNDKYIYNKASKAWRLASGSEPWGFTSMDDYYTFFAYSPYGTNKNGVSVSTNSGVPSINYTVPSTCINQPDLLYAIPNKDIHPSSNGAVALTMEHILSTVSFSVKADESTPKIQTLTVHGVASSGTMNWDMQNNVPVWTLTVPKNNQYESFNVKIGTYSAITNTAVQVTAKDGYLMMLPQTLNDGASVDVVLEGDIEYNLKIDKGTQWLAGNHYKYSIDLSSGAVEIVYDVEEVSNCYIVNPVEGKDLVVQIPVQGRINTFWQDYCTYKPYTPFSAETDLDTLSSFVNWRDFDIYSDNFDWEYEYVRDKDNEIAIRVNIPSQLTEGNLVFSVVNGSDDVLWSWHLWITDYNPDAIANKFRNTITAGEELAYKTPEYPGAVHRYVDPKKCSNKNKVWGGYYSDKFIMDRNIGANTAEKSECYAGALYYQWGRKDPLPAQRVRYNDGTNDFEKQFAAQWDLDQAIPFAGYYMDGGSSAYDYYWCCLVPSANSSNYMWSDQNVSSSDYDGKKSIFDPSPLGWRVPEQAVWANFDKQGTTQGDGFSGTAFFPKEGYLEEIVGKLVNDGCSYIWCAEFLHDGRAKSFEEENLFMDANTNAYANCGYCVRAIEQ